MNSDFIDALRQLEREREIPMASLIEHIEAALESAYKPKHGGRGVVRVRLNTSKASVKVFCEQTVVDGEPEDNGHVSLEEARRLKPDAQVGEVLSEEITPENFGRIAAMTAKQVVVQRLRDVDRERVYAEFAERENEVVTGTVQRWEQRSVIVGLGRTEAILPPSEQVPNDRYRINDRLKMMVLEVRRDPKGPRIIVSRSHPSLIRRLFELEVPEIADGTVVIKSVAREAGARTKIAVSSRDDKVDPVGSCVGHRGSRVQAIVNELNDEKIDIVRWSENLSDYVGAALSPAKIASIVQDEVGRGALVIVPDNQLSLAIGKEGQNVRLAARLTSLRIDIRSETQIKTDGPPKPRSESGEAPREEIAAPASDDPAVEPASEPAMDGSDVPLSPEPAPEPLPALEAAAADPSTEDIAA